MSGPTRRSLYGMLARFRRRHEPSFGGGTSQPAHQRGFAAAFSSPAAAAAAANAADPDAAANAAASADDARGYVAGNHAPRDFPPALIRNFSIIAHVDHGKSTLADALMKRLGAIAPNARAQYLDKLEVERTRGITVKAQTASLVAPSGVFSPAGAATGQARGPPRGGGGPSYLLNLVDTPGHVDFSYEVSRSLAACQGALLLVDSARGVQAQTAATYLLALEQGLEIVPVLTKVDLPGAEPARVRREMADVFGFAEEDMLEVSAKRGFGLEAVVRAVVERIPPPGGSAEAPLRLLLFDAYVDAYRGVVSLVAAVDGVLKTGDRLASCAALADQAAAAVAAGAGGASSSSSSSSSSASLSLEALEVGVLAPEPHATGELRAGQVGYVITGLRDLRAARVGDTWVRRPTTTSAAAAAATSSSGVGRGDTSAHTTDAALALALALPGFRPAKAVVFAGVFPASADAYSQLASAIERLTLSDASVVVKKEQSDALGPGFRCGFLGPLHLDVFLQRLEQEYGAEVVASAPSVPVEVDVAGPKGQGGGGGGGGRVTLAVETPADWPRGKSVLEVREPTVVATIVAPAEYCGAVMELAAARRGEQVGHSFLGSGSGSSVADGASAAIGGGGGGGGGGRVALKYVLPLAELARGLYAALKQATSGYASLDYEPGPMRAADLRLLEVLVNGAPLDPLARLVHASEGERAGRALVARLAGLLEREMFEVALQASVGGRVVARETVRARRRDVLAKCYGGDVSRKKKLLERQKEGKKAMRRIGSVRVPADVFPQLLKPV